MKEYTKIKILDSGLKEEELLSLRHILFKFKDDRLRRLYGGRPIRIDGEDLILKTQGYYENIPKSIKIVKIMKIL